MLYCSPQAKDTAERSTQGTRSRSRELERIITLNLRTLKWPRHHTGSAPSALCSNSRRQCQFERKAVQIQFWYQVLVVNFECFFSHFFEAPNPRHHPPSRSALQPTAMSFIYLGSSIRSCSDVKHPALGHERGSVAKAPQSMFGDPSS